MRYGFPVKTTIEVPEALMREIKAIAVAEGGTIRSVIEEALRRELDRRRSAIPWAPRSELVVGGSGLTQEAQGMSWAEIRDLASRPFEIERSSQ